MRLAYDAILFDFDGVLVDSEPVHFACWRETLAARGVDLAWDYYRKHAIGVTDAAFVERFRVVPGAGDWLLDALREKRERFRNRTAEAALVTAEVRDLLGQLRVPLAVVTSSSRRDVEPALEAGGIRGFFGACVFRETVARPKPHPEPYRTAAALLGATRPLVVEDSEPGERSARAAGFDCLRIGAPSELRTALLKALA
jgi:beta-phosphoglucomutase